MYQMEYTLIGWLEWTRQCWKHLPYHFVGGLVALHSILLEMRKKEDGGQNILGPLVKVDLLTSSCSLRLQEISSSLIVTLFAVLNICIGSECVDVVVTI